MSDVAFLKSCLGQYPDWPKKVRIEFPHCPLHPRHHPAYQSSASTKSSDRWISAGQLTRRGPAMALTAVILMAVS